MSDTRTECPRCHRSEFVFIDGEERCPICGLTKHQAIENKIKLDIAIFGNAFVIHNSDGTREVLNPEDVTIRRKK